MSDFPIRITIKTRVAWIRRVCLRGSRVFCDRCGTPHTVLDASVLVGSAESALDMGGEAKEAAEQLRKRIGRKPHSQPRGRQPCPGCGHIQRWMAWHAFLKLIAWGSGVGVTLFAASYYVLYLLPGPTGRSAGTVPEGLLWSLIGAAIGAVACILFTPSTRRVRPSSPLAIDDDALVAIDARARAADVDTVLLWWEESGPASDDFPISLGIVDFAGDSPIELDAEAAIRRAFVEINRTAGRLDRTGNIPRTTEDAPSRRPRKTRRR